MVGPAEEINSAPRGVEGCVALKSADGPLATKEEPSAKKGGKFGLVIRSMKQSQPELLLSYS